MMMILMMMILMMMILMMMMEYPGFFDLRWGRGSPFHSHPILTLNEPIFCLDNGVHFSELLLASPFN